MDRESLDVFTPKMDHKLFYELYGEDYEEWFKYADDLFAIQDRLGYGVPGSVYGRNLLPAFLSPFNIYFTNKSLKKVGDGSKTIEDIIRKANSSGLRSDEFTDNHDGLHVLFAGCSVTFGDGMPDDLIWPSLVYSRLSDTHKMSGFYNVAFNGANHIQIIHQVYKYIGLYGNPDIILINLPDINRIRDAGIPKDMMFLVISMYEMLEQYCMSNNIKLVSFSWDVEVNYNPAKQEIEKMWFDLEEDPRQFLGPTFHRFDLNRRDAHMFDYEQKNQRSLYNNHFVRALDIVHPGLAEHDFYATFALECLDDV